MVHTITKQFNPDCYNMDSNTCRSNYNRDANKRKIGMLINLQVQKHMNFDYHIVVIITCTPEV